jgi:hypothetical protein
LDCRGHWRGFQVSDSTGQRIAYVYFEEEPGRRSAAKLLSKDEARRVAANIAKLPVEWTNNEGIVAHTTTARNGAWDVMVAPNAVGGVVLKIGGHDRVLLQAAP